MRIPIPHPERVMFPQARVTRLEMVAYYRAVAPFCLPHWRGRALTVVRWPQGINGAHFYQRYLRPDSREAITIDGEAQLMWWVGQGAVEFHVPLGPKQDPLGHDWAVLDLDPHPPAGWREVVQVAEIFLELFETVGVPTYLKTSGRSGLHLYLPVEPTPADELTAMLAKLCRAVADRFSPWATVERLRNRRGGRVYLDYLQNGGQRTMVGVFSLRGTPDARVSTPIAPSELGVAPEAYTLRRVAAEAAERARWFPSHPLRVALRDRLQALTEGVPKRWGR
ncbi:MAG: DNA primase [Firmicutes bacterium]|nr:DNA primase [Alicyclobacillaceae bacterium]MCL6496751.1 DNA primase [Bacillota bacterium]